MFPLPLPNPTCLLKVSCFFSVPFLPIPSVQLSTQTSQTPQAKIQNHLLHWREPPPAMCPLRASSLHLLEQPKVSISVHIPSCFSFLHPSPAFSSLPLPSLFITAQGGYFILPGGTQESKTRTTRTKSKLFIAKPISKETTGR